MKKQTEWRFFSEHGDDYRIRAEYGWTKFEGQAPYFSLTGEAQRRRVAGVDSWAEDSFGQLHAALAQHFPELSHLAKWHLCSTEGPMHYAANGRYWWEAMHGLRVGDDGRATDAEKCFCGTVVFGAVAGDEMPPAAEGQRLGKHRCSACDHGWTLPEGAHPSACPACGAGASIGKVRIVFDVGETFRLDNADVIAEWCAARLPALLDAMMLDLLPACGDPMTGGLK